MDWTEHSKSRATIKLGSQPTGYSIFKYDEMSKENLPLMGIIYRNSLSSSTWLLPLPQINHQVSRKKIFPVFEA